MWGRKEKAASSSAADMGGVGEDDAADDGLDDVGRGAVAAKAASDIADDDTVAAEAARSGVLRPGAWAGDCDALAGFITPRRRWSPTLPTQSPSVGRLTMPPSLLYGVTTPTVTRGARASVVTRLLSCWPSVRARLSRWAAAFECDALALDEECEGWAVVEGGLCGLCVGCVCCGLCVLWAVRAVMQRGRRQRRWRVFVVGNRADLTWSTPAPHPHAARHPDLTSHLTQLTVIASTLQPSDRPLVSLSPSLSLSLSSLSLLPFFALPLPPPPLLSPPCPS